MFLSPDHSEQITSGKIRSRDKSRETVFYDRADNRNKPKQSITQIPSMNINVKAMSGEIDNQSTRLIIKTLRAQHIEIKVRITELGNPHSQLFSQQQY